MRYYDFAISSPTTGAVWIVTKAGSFAQGPSYATTFTSWVNGANNPAAQNFEIDLPVAPYHVPQGKAVLRVWGVGLQQIGQAANLNGQNFKLLAGMKPGLPLTNPANGGDQSNQAGLIAQGQIFQAFGNWQGVNQTLDLIVYPGASDTNQDISWNWLKGTQLSSALAQCFKQAFPLYRPTIQIGNIVAPGDDQGHYNSLTRLANHVFDMSVKYGTATYGDQYPGVNIVLNGDSIIATDSTQVISSTPIELKFQDLIGQPTWIEPNRISFKAVMRHDIQIGSLVKFPAAVISPYVLTTDAAAYPNVPARNKSVFQGTFFVNEVHHFGNFRQPDADSWVTAYTAVPTIV